MLSTRVDETNYATSAFEAELILDSKEITHLICDHWFGAGQTLGTDLAALWKKKYPSIERIVLLTGADISTLKSPPEVNTVLSKSVETSTLIESLELA